MARRVSSQRFVGRIPEIGVLSDALEASGRGETVTVLVSGEAGVGKTRLVGELARVASERGARVFTGGCVALGEGGLPYGPVAAALHDLVMGLDGPTLEALLGQAAPDLARIIPGLDARLTSAVGALVPPEWMKVRLFDAVVGLLQRLGETTPAVFVFEDLHWADPASLDLIGFLVRSPRRGGRLTVMTYRSDELHRRHPLLPWLAEIDRVAGVERIDLERLTRPETAEQIGAILATEPSDLLVDSIFRRSGGNPFFAEELIAADERGVSRRLSSSLREILLGRLAGIGKSARAVVDVASVAGQPIRVDALAAVAGLPDTEVPTGIREALDAQILAPTDNEDERLGFRHALMQEAAYGDLLPGERRRLHLAFARMLEDQGEPQEARQAVWWAERAHHARAGNDLAGALVASVGAGQAARRAAAFADALRYFDQAIGLWEAVPDPGTLVPEDRSDLLRLAAESAGFAGDGERSVVLWRAALDSLEPGSAPERRAALLVALGTAKSTVGDYDDAVAATRTANDLLADGSLSAIRALALANLGRELLGTLQWDESRRACESAIEMAQAVDDRATEAIARARLATALAALGRGEHALDQSQLALSIVRSTRDRSVFLAVINNVARIHEGAGDQLAAVETFLEGARVARELGLSTGSFERRAAYNLWLTGRTTEARALMLPVAREHLAECVGGHRVGRGVHITSALMDARGGDFESAASHLAVVEDDQDPEVWLVRTEFALWTGRPDDAAALARLGLSVPNDPLDEQSFRSWLLRLLVRAEADRAEIARRRRRSADEYAAVERAADATKAMIDLTKGPWRYEDAYGGELSPSAAVTEAEHARAAGRHDPAAWATAAVAWDALGRPAEVAYARWREGEAILGSSGPRAEARGALVEAASIARELGAEPLVRDIERLAARARLTQPAGTTIPGTAVPNGSPGSGAPGSGADLTRREREVLSLLAEGRTNRQIAGALFISESTAGVHVSHILGKLEVAGRTEAVSAAHRLGLVG